MKRELNKELFFDLLKYIHKTHNIKFEQQDWHWNLFKELVPTNNIERTIKIFKEDYGIILLFRNSANLYKIVCS